MKFKLYLFINSIMTASVSTPIKSTWLLKDHKVQIVGSHSGQEDTWYLKILWSPKLGLTYYKPFSGDVHDSTVYAEAKQIAEYIMKKGFIRPDSTTKYSDDNPAVVNVWEKDFYPHKDFLRTTAD